MLRSVGHYLHELTRGQPFAFMIMPYEDSNASRLFDRIQPIVEASGIVCLRADHLKLSGHDLLHKIHEMIDRADLVIADISGKGGQHSPNVYYEVGYAVAKDKPPLLVARKETEVPTDLRGLEVLTYGETAQEFQHFDSELREYMQLHLGRQTGLLRDMLVGSDPWPAIVFANPKHPNAESAFHGHLPETTTFGDHLGIVGLVSAYGMLFGEGRSPDLVSAAYFDASLANQDANFFLIGSKKVNKLCGDFLQNVQRGRGPNWYIGRVPHEEETGDYTVKLYRASPNGPGEVRSTTAKVGERHIQTVDHGIVIRAPHPHYPGRIVVIMAGPHSLGTSGACLAATRSTLLNQFCEKLGKNRKAFGDQSQAIWALVKTQSQTSRISETDVEVVEAGVYT